MSFGAMKGKKKNYRENPYKHFVEHLRRVSDFRLLLHLLTDCPTSEFPDIFDVDHFKAVLADDVRVVSSLPSTHIRTRPVVEKRTPLHVTARWIRSRYLRRVSVFLLFFFLYVMYDDISDVIPLSLHSSPERAFCFCVGWILFWRRSFLPICRNSGARLRSMLSDSRLRSWRWVTDLRRG